MLSKNEIKTIRAEFPEARGLDNSSITSEWVGWVRDERREAARRYAANLPTLQAEAQRAYDEELFRYAAKNPSGKNGEKAALRAARKIMANFAA